MREITANPQSAVSKPAALIEIDESTKERFVVFLDIMGFKDRVARNKHEKILKQLETFQNTISSYVSEYQESNIQLSLFSDSILIFSQDDSIDSLKSIAAISAKIMMSAFQQQETIPLKGAIAQGKVTCNQSKQLYFGQALIDAYLLEENVKYYGIVVHHSAELKVKTIADGSFRDVKTCLKSGDISHYELYWYNTILKEAEPQNSISDCLNNLRLTVSDEPRKYIDNTLKIIGQK